MFPIAKELLVFDKNILSPDISRLVKDASLPIIVTAEIVLVSINPKEASPPHSVAPPRFKKPSIISTFVKDASPPIMLTAEIVSVSYTHLTLPTTPYV